ncbi:unnamed protein product [Ectocarpus sp. 12 AP-2014]
MVSRRKPSTHGLTGNRSGLFWERKDGYIYLSPHAVRDGTMQSEGGLQLLRRTALQHGLRGRRQRSEVRPQRF